MTKYKYAPKYLNMLQKPEYAVNMEEKYNISTNNFIFCCNISRIIILLKIIKQVMLIEEFLDFGEN
jgi:hypothetical protein